MDTTATSMVRKISTSQENINRTSGSWCFEKDIKLIFFTKIGTNIWSDKPAYSGWKVIKLSK